MAISQAITYLGPKDIVYLGKLHETLGGSVGDQKATDMFKYGKDIHLYIARMSRNETLFDIIKQLREESYRGYVYYMEQFLYSSSEAERQVVKDRLVDGHNKMVEALQNRNVEEAIKYLKADLDTMNEFIIGS